MYLFIVFSTKYLSVLVHLEPTNQRKPSFRIEPQDLLVTHYDSEDHQQKIYHKHANNQITQCESEPQDIE